MDVVLDVMLLGQRRFHELSLRAQVVLRQLPLNLTMILVCGISVLSDTSDFADLGFVASQLLALALLGACAAVPWDRLPYWSFLVIPVLDFYPIALLRFSDNDLLPGLGLLAVFPVMWLAGSGYRPRGAVAFGTISTLLMVWVPHFLDGTANVSTLSSELLTPFTMLTVGVATSVSALSSSAQRRQIAELLDRSETRQQLLETIVDTVDVGVVVVDTAGEILLMNARQQELHRAALPDGADTAREPELLVFADGSDKLVPSERRPAARAVAGETITHELFRLGTGQRSRTVSVSARPFRDAGGEMMGSALAFSDVTDVVAAVRARDTFLAAMSHEFRTPLTSLLGYAELLHDDPSLSPAARSDTLVMARNARHLNKMVDDILAAATPGATETHQPSAMDLAQLVRDAVDSASPDAARRDITIHLTADGELPVYGDRTGFVRLLDNLISNALKYSSDGTAVTLRTGREGRWAVFSVSDQGIGIPPEDLPRIFTRFQRSSAAVRSGIPGTGLGLALAREVAVRHGGDLECESELGVGSTFTLRLPLRIGAAERR
ncbi:sensor histidine kinase [Sinomonas albida]|uniref:sensor histidine kinase n=1 Tax=Sinomonas albida TaxID=369942 RepID=UPI0010A91175|nr:ATP-binding protein [Sinomonas albida]